MTIGANTMIEENEQEELENQEEEQDLVQDYDVDVDTMIDAIRQKNLGQAKSHFEDIIGDKVNASLEAEKIRLANVVYNGASEEEATEDEEVETEEPSYEDAEWEDITSEIEDSLEQ